ncbi:hypothetical protein [Microbacterium sp. 2FI]|uniref:hypothetical protein n=1 Tax=Microbacterium sp. 2FI TaxID=2502193 RepID=UPI0020177F08|nr:hypothetical protein [Microbacterium sp. 2FI]
MTPRHVRALRGAVGASIATLVGATAHTLAGGGAPSPGVVAAVAILAWPLAVLLAGRRLSAWRVGATVLASQALLHVAFSLTASADHVRRVAHDHQAAGASDLLAGAEMSGLLPDPVMLAGHVLAAAATMLALYGGERMLRALGRGIRSVLGRSSTPALRPLTLPSIPASAPPVHAGAVLLSDASRRGPPAFVIAV